MSSPYSTLTAWQAWFRQRAENQDQELKNMGFLICISCRNKWLIQREKLWLIDINPSWTISVKNFNLVWGLKTNNCLTTDREEFAMCAISVFTERTKMYKGLLFWYFWSKPKVHKVGSLTKDRIKFYLRKRYLPSESNLWDDSC